VSASKDEDVMLMHLSEDIDTKILEWLTTYEIPSLNLIAIVLARLTWLAKQSNCREDFLELLKAPEQILNEEDGKDYLH
jgi:hypothetical protein